MKILLTGATGLVGKHLSISLLREGHHVYALARTPEKLPELPPKNVFTWSDTVVPQEEVFNGIECVIHLAGENIADKLWTKKRKKKLRDSRITSTKNICKTLSLLTVETRPKIFICASAIGFYGHSYDSKDETSVSGQGFLAELCKDWETEALFCESLGIRTVLLRTGLVLAKEGGLLKKTGPIVLGDGNQWMSWIHIDDIVQFILFSIKNSSINGPYNLTSPNPVTHKDFINTYIQNKQIPFTISVPKVFLKCVLQELSDALLSSHKVLPLKAISSGFNFKFEYLQDALKDLLYKNKLTENLFTTRQFVPCKRSEVFSFFSKAENLEILTPRFLNFRILNQSTPEIQKNTIINYNLKIHGIPVKWRTLIKEWNPETSFVDYQIKGPYQKWHHLHTFEEVAGGTLISDKVTFKIYGWIFGLLLLPFIKKDIKKIFNYRQQKVKEIFLY